MLRYADAQSCALLCVKCRYVRAGIGCEEMSSVGGKTSASLLAGVHLQGLKTGAPRVPLGHLDFHCHLLFERTPFSHVRMGIGCEVTS